MNQSKKVSSCPFKTKRSYDASVSSLTQLIESKIWVLFQKVKEKTFFQTREDKTRQEKRRQVKQKATKTSKENKSLLLSPFLLVLSEKDKTQRETETWEQMRLEEGNKNSRDPSFDLLRRWR